MKSGGYKRKCELKSKEARRLLDKSQTIAYGGKEWRLW